MMQKFLAIALGGVFGALSRYGLAQLIHGLYKGGFPAGTLFVNLSGSFAIGFLWALFDNTVVAPNVRLFLTVGFLGAYTTFSTFALENFVLLKDREFGVFFVNVLLTNVAGILLVFAGYFLCKYLFLLIKGG